MPAQVVLLIDNAAVVDGIRGGKSATLGPTYAHTDMWHRFWGLFVPLVARVEVAVVKIESHPTAAQIRAASPPPFGVPLPSKRGC